MNEKRNETIGKITVGVFFGTIVYIVYKKVKRMKLEKNMITVDNLNDILNEREEEVAEDIVLSDIPEVGEFELKIGTDPNSQYAMEQFINMRTAEFKKGTSDEKVLRMLFNHNFEPNSSADRSTYDNLLDNRIEFFGESSKWTGGATWAELILYYAERMTYDMDNTLEYWSNYIIEHLQLRPGMNDDELFTIFDTVAEHTFVNHDSGFFGLFGLDNDGMDNLYGQLSKSMYTTYTFEMEYNAFLNMVNNS